MINKQEFKEIGKELKKFEEEREDSIQKSREIITISKQIIYSIHRNDISKAEKLSQEIKKKMSNLSSNSYDTAMVTVAQQEFVEAVTFLDFVKKKVIPTRKELKIETEPYLLGLCDLTGELVRMAVNCAIRKQIDEVMKIRELIDEIYGEMLLFDFRNGEMRKKYDSIKWNLKKVEDIILEISMYNGKNLKQWV
ncbi:hypothetical protein J4471_00780 [Candidatus Woesearchaeota archaeon]|nr:hypothetical protein [Candidatus Woesearchaeota archaeon]